MGLVDRNVQLVTSQVRKWVLAKGPRAKVVWSKSLPEVLPSINGRLIRIHEFTPSEILMGHVPEWKFENSEQALQPSVPPTADASMVNGLIGATSKGKQASYQ